MLSMSGRLPGLQAALGPMSSGVVPNGAQPAASLTTSALFGRYVFQNFRVLVGGTEAVRAGNSGIREAS
jgi:hypothetical protein